jgi:hypothetical protein
MLLQNKFHEIFQKYYSTYYELDVKLPYHFLSTFVKLSRYFPVWRKSYHSEEVVNTMDQKIKKIILFENIFLSQLFIFMVKKKSPKTHFK